MPLKTLFSLSAGALGILTAMPADVWMVRMMTDKVLPPEQRRNYKSLGNAIVRIIK